MLVLHRSFHESVERKRHRIDYTGAVLLAVGGSLLILGLLEGGVAWAWDSPASIAVLSVAVVLLVVFGFVESRAAEPILPLWVFRRRMLIGANATSLCVGRDPDRPHVVRPAVRPGRARPRRRGRGLRASPP